MKNRFLGYAGAALGALMFLALLPAGASLIFSLLTRERGNDTVPLITFGFDAVFSVLVLALQAADIALLALLMTAGRRKGLLTSCLFLFGGLLVNMLFAGVCMLISDSHVRMAAMYSFIEGMLFLTSALMLSTGKDKAIQ